MLNIIGLIAGFIGAICLLIDPNSWILGKFTKVYIEKKDSELTVPEYNACSRRWLIAQRLVRRAGIFLIAAGFALQLLAALSDRLGPWW
ncbi:hypothetical protein CUR86_08455 [Salinicola acroporae]|uniref:Uncharacterized protein n=1 Tax=Salinicola acroporae TaxID=1541440 RepID=A0ABT6I4M9_9GAMM|nr:hypothetical protein [Salinicola acroporae]